MGKLEDGQILQGFEVHLLNTMQEVEIGKFVEALVKPKKPKRTILNDNFVMGVSCAKVLHCKSHFVG